MPPDLLPASLQRYVVPAIGLTATVMGLTGILRRETGALSPSERHTALGRILTPLLSGIWLLAGLILLASQLLPAPLQEDVVGFTSLIAMAIFLVVLIGALIASALSRSHHPDPVPAPAPPSPDAPVVLPTPSGPRFRRLDAVTHPDYGYGRVLATYHAEGHEMVAVRFWNETYTVPAESLNPHLPAS